MKKRYLTLALCCGAVALAGCGSSSSSNSSTGVAKGPPSGAVFSADLNSLCKQGNAAAKKFNTSPTKLAAFISSFLPKFRALSASGSQQVIYAKFVANLQKEASALKAGNGGAASAASTANDALAIQLHAPACGSTA